MICMGKSLKDSNESIDALITDKSISYSDTNSELL